MSGAALARDTRQVKVPYDTELAALGSTYADALAADLGELRAALCDLGGSPALFVGAGGSMVAAQLAARLHEETWRQPARACTPLGLLDAPTLLRRGAVLFSSSVKHPDARRVMQDFQRKRFAPTALLTHRLVSEVQNLAGGDCRVVTLPPLAQTDGFLATGSVLQIATLLLRAFDRIEGLPATLETGADPDGTRDEVLVLAPPQLLTVAADLEVRLVESGLASVQVADYRNFSHGRHTGFARRLACTTVIALLDGSSRDLGEATLAALPNSADVRRWDGGEAWPGALVRLLVRSMHLAGQRGRLLGMDPARPAVPAFGRRLYHLSLGPRVPGRAAGGIERKLLAAGVGDDPGGREAYERAARSWVEVVQDCRFGGVVLDYDGTVCWTRRRFELPEPVVQDALSSVLEAGGVLGFASGRGRSLHVDLRRWVPLRNRDRVVVGLYNGAVVLTLAQDLPDLRAPTPWSRSVAAALGTLPFADRVTVEERGAQVSVTGSDGLTHCEVLVDLVRHCLSRAGVAATIASSGHAVDIVRDTSTKVTVAERVEQLASAPALAIGDQGQLGGNDHALLARNAATLTVDRCSADPGSCWFVGSGEFVGPALLHRLLRDLRRRRGGLALTRFEVA